MPHIRTSRVARKAAVGFTIVERVIFIVEQIGVDVRRFIEKVTHVAVVILIFASFAVAVAFEGVRKKVHSENTEKIATRVVVAIACAAGDPRKVHADMNAGVPKRCFDFRELVVVLNSTEFTEGISFWSSRRRFPLYGFLSLRVAVSR